MTFSTSRNCAPETIATPGTQINEVHTVNLAQPTIGTLTSDTAADHSRHDSLLTCSSKHSSLTRENLRILEGKDSTVGSSSEESSDTEDMSENNSSRTRSRVGPNTVTYKDTDFLDEIKIRGCISVDMKDNPPLNKTELEDALRKPRDDTPTVLKLNGLWHLTTTANIENQIIENVLPYIIKTVEMGYPGTKLKSAHSKWNKDLPLAPFESTNLKIPPPNPDITIGYFGDQMPARLAHQYLGSFSTPIKSQNDLKCPCFAVEVKGLESIAFAESQNLHNAGVMLRNLRKLREVAGMKEEDIRNNFDRRVKVLTLSYTRREVQIRCCWSQLCQERNVVKYHSAILKEWQLSDRSQGSMMEIVDSIRNAIDWVTDHNREWILADLKKVHERRENKDDSLPEL